MGVFLDFFMNKLVLLAIWLPLALVAHRKFYIKEFKDDWTHIYVKNKVDIYLLKSCKRDFHI